MHDLKHVRTSVLPHIVKELLDDLALGFRRQLVLLYLFDALRGIRPRLVVDGLTHELMVVDGSPGSPLSELLNVVAHLLQLILQLRVLLFLVALVDGGLDDVVVFLYQILLFDVILRVGIALLHQFDSIKHILAFVYVHQTELFEINLSSLIIINGIINILEILNGEINSRVLAASNELLEAERAIEIDVKVSKCPSVVSELFFDSLVDATQNILDVGLLLFGVVVNLVFRLAILL